MVKHYQGDDSDLKLLFGALVETLGGRRPWRRTPNRSPPSSSDAEHPTLAAPLPRPAAFVPMVELLRHLEANDS